MAHFQVYWSQLFLGFARGTESPDLKAVSLSFGFRETQIDEVVLLEM